MVVEASVVVGYVIAWAMRKAGRIGKGLDVQADRAIDAGLARLDAVVSQKLGEDPALVKLGLEASAGPEVAVRTRQRVELAVQDATEEDPEFAARLAETVGAVRVVERQPRAEPEHSDR